MSLDVQAVAGLSYCVITDRGKVRETNQDRGLIEPWPDGSALLVVIADGMGGLAGGEVASEITAESFKTLLAEPLPEGKSERYEKLLGCFYLADEMIKKRASTDFALLNMASTAVAAIVTPLECLYLYAGDCRLYHFRDGIAPFITSDHSVVRFLVETGRLTAEGVADHPMRAVVTSCLSASVSSRLSVDPKWNESSPMQPAFRELLPGDRLLFCTDGLCTKVSVDDLVALANHYSVLPDIVAKACVEAALQTGGEDNVTVAVINVSRI